VTECLTSIFNTEYSNLCFEKVFAKTQTKCLLHSFPCEFDLTALVIS
jgi:hypothetical protein